MTFTLRISITKKQAMFQVNGYGIALDYPVKERRRKLVLFVFDHQGDRALWKGSLPARAAK